MSRILLDELNVKALKTGAEVAIDEHITPELHRRPHARSGTSRSGLSAAKLDVDHRIELVLETESPMLKRTIEDIQRQSPARHLRLRMNKEITETSVYFCRKNRRYET